MQRLEEGGQLGRYQILKRLGAGAMGEVFLAEDPQIGRQVALKTVRVEEGRAKEIEERKLRLLREARAAGRLLHPNIVTLFDAGEDGEILYLAFEFVEGRDLAERVEEGPQLSLGEVLAIVRQAADGARLRPPAGRGPPRHQAEQPDDHGRRPGEDRRLRHRQRRRPDLGPDDDRLGGRQPALHVARADPRRRRSTAAPTSSRSASSSTRSSATGARSRARR